MSNFSKGRARRVAKREVKGCNRAHTFGLAPVQMHRRSYGTEAPVSVWISCSTVSRPVTWAWTTCICELVKELAGSSSTGWQASMFQEKFRNPSSPSHRQDTEGSFTKEFLSVLGYRGQTPDVLQKLIGRHNQNFRCGLKPCGFSSAANSCDTASKDNDPHAHRCRAHCKQVLHKLLCHC